MTFKFDQRLYILRHGTTESSKRDRYIGGREESLPIAAEGVREMRDAATRLLLREPALEALTTIFLSPTLRAQQSADIFCEAISCRPKIVKDVRLHDLDQGELSGKTRDQLTDLLIQEMVSLGADFRPPGGETRLEVGERMFRWLQALDPEQRLVVAISHVNSIRELISRVMDVRTPDPRMTEVWNGHAAVFSRRGEKWLFQGLNW